MTWTSGWADHRWLDTAEERRLIATLEVLELPDGEVLSRAYVAIVNQHDGASRTIVKTDEDGRRSRVRKVGAGTPDQ